MRWSPETGILPPLQPKEVGVTTLEVNNYTWLDDGSNHMNIRVNGYQFYSHLNQVVLSFGYGLLDGQGSPSATYSWVDYAKAATGSDDASCQCNYIYQTCACAMVEGGTTFYAGYDYWRRMLTRFYDLGVPVYYGEDDKFLIYDAVVPWDDDVYDRDMNYTIYFEKSTELLRRYSHHGTEWCCEKPYGCVEQGQRFCPDGAPPRQLYAQMDQEFIDYQNISGSSWPSNFFLYYPPVFSSVLAGMGFAESDTDSGHSEGAFLAAVIAGPIGGIILGALSHRWFIRRRGGGKHLLAAANAANGL